MRQQARKVAQLHQTVDKMVRMLEAHAVCEETQRLGTKEWLEDRERKRDAHLKDNLLWGTGITDMTAKILTATRPGKREPESETESGLQASQHADTTQRERKQDPQQQQQW